MNTEYHSLTYYHNIYIESSHKIPVPLPEVLLQQKKQAQFFYPEAQYKIWGMDDCRIFIKKNFDNSVIEAFDKLTPYAFKADLMRYCLLYKLGGLYIDLSIKLQNRWNIPLDYKVAAFTQMYPNMDSWLNTMQSLLWSEPGRQEWKLAIHKIVRHCSSKYYGPHDHYVTGPALIGYCFAETMLENDKQTDTQFMGEVRFTETEGEQKTAFFITPNRTLIATKRPKTAGSLIELGINTNNHYPQLWRSKRIYGENFSHWHFNEPMLLVPQSLKKTSNGLYVPFHYVGLICYGPYIDIEPEQYILEINFTAFTYIPFLLLIEVVHGEKHRIYLKKRVCVLSKKKTQTITITLPIQKNLKRMEFRLRNITKFSGILHTMTLRKEKQTL